MPRDKLVVFVAWGMRWFAVGALALVDVTCYDQQRGSERLGLGLGVRVRVGVRTPRGQKKRTTGRG